MQASTPSYLGDVISTRVFYYETPDIRRHSTSTQNSYSSEKKLDAFIDDDIDENELAAKCNFTYGFIVDRLPIKVRVDQGSNRGNYVYILGIMEIQEGWYDYSKFKRMLAEKTIVRLYKDDNGDIVNVSMQLGDTYKRSSKIAAVALCTPYNPKCTPKLNYMFPTQITDYRMDELLAKIISSKIANNDREIITSKGYDPRKHPTLMGIGLPPVVAKLPTVGQIKSSCSEKVKSLWKRSSDKSESREKEFKSESSEAETDFKEEKSENNQSSSWVSSNSKPTGRVSSIRISDRHN